MPRSRGGISGTLMVLAGAWGALIPFVGPYFDWTIGPDSAFDMTAGRFWLSLVPGIATVVGALILTSSANRVTAAMGAWIALAGGVWFAVGPSVSRLWNDGDTLAGAPLGGPTRQALETLTYFEGLGALITALAAFALGRVSVRAARDLVARREEAGVVAPAADDDRERTGRFRRRPAEEREPAVAGPAEPEERKEVAGTSPRTPAADTPPPIGPGERSPHERPLS